MKVIYFTLFVSVLFIGCQLPVDNSASEAFEKNSNLSLPDFYDMTEYFS